MSDNASAGTLANATTPEGDDGAIPPIRRQDFAAVDAILLIGFISRFYSIWRK